MLPFLIPLAGAVFGGAVSAAFGGAILTGASIGWMIGSWLFPLGGDAGAGLRPADLQDVNQSLRGTDIPIMFGTNRVNSNVIWRADFETNKIKEKSGGFFGIGGSSQTVGYEYTIDVVYHLGIPYTDNGFQIFAAWWNDEPISAKALSNFTNRATGDHPLVSTAVFEGHLDKFLNTNTKQGHGLGYGDDRPGAHFSGGQPTTEAWVPSDTLISIGHNVRWPYTVWIGFEELDLGSTPAIPAISWEVGPIPAAGGIEPGEGSGFTAANSLNISNTDCGRNLDKHKCLWAFKGSLLRCISETGSVLYSSTASAWVQRLNQATVQSMFPWNNTLSRGIQWVEPIMNGERVVVWHSTYDGVNHNLSCAILQPISTIDTPAILGVVWCYDILNGATRGDGIGMDHAHLQRPQDPLLFHGRGALTLNNFRSYVFPDPQGIEAGAYNNGYGASTVGLAVGTTATWTSYRVPRIEYFLPTDNDRANQGYDYISNGAQQAFSFQFMLPIELDGAIKSALWFPFTLGVHQYHSGAGANPNPAYQNSISLLSSADLGAAFYYLFDQHPDGPELLYENLQPPSGSLGSTDWQFLAATWTLATSLFRKGANITFPFSDDQLNLDGTANANANYDPKCFFKKDNDSAWCLGWRKSFASSTDTFGGRRMPAKVRGYNYDRSTGIFTEFDDGVRSILVSSDDAAFIAGNDDTTHKAGFITTGDELIFSGFEGGDFYSASFGTFNCAVSSVVDMTPPEIIRHIMVNTLYGLSFPVDRIHSTWESARDYCGSEGMLISGIYRTSQDKARYIEELLAVYGGYLVWSQGQLKFGFVTGSDTVVRTLTNEHHVVLKPGDPPINVQKGSRQDTFNKIQVEYLDRQLAYRTNMVEVADEIDIEETGVRVRTFPARFVMKEGTATKIAHRTLWSNLYARDLYQGHYGWKDADLEPGDLVWLVDTGHPELQDGRRARLVSIEEKKPGQFAYNAIEEDPTFLNDQGFVTSETTASPGNGFEAAGIPADFVAFEVPREFGETPAVFFATYPSANVAGHRIYTSGTSNGVYTLADEVNFSGRAGKLTRAYGPSPRFEYGGSLTFLQTEDHTVSSPDYVRTVVFSGVDPVARSAGDALFLVGSEIMAVESMVAVGSNQYSVSRFYRGWGGTHIHSHASSDRFYWLDSAIMTRPYLEGEVGKRLFYKATEVDFFGGETDLSSVTAKSYTIRGTWHGPQVPGELHAYIVRSEAGVFSHDLRGLDKFAVNSGDDITLLWADAARLKGFGFGTFGFGGFGHFTTDTTSHQWRVEVIGSGGAVVRSLVVGSGAFVYTHSANVADNGAFGPVTIRVTPFNDFCDATRISVKTLDMFERA